MSKFNTNPRFGIVVLTRHGASCTMHCDTREQAKECIKHWKLAVELGEHFVTFSTATGDDNLTLTHEIIGMSVLDYDVMDAIAVNQYRDSNRIKSEASLEFPQDEYDEDK